MAKTIDITTTQNVTIEYELALLRERIIGWLLDVLIVMIAWFILFQIFRTIGGDEIFENMGWMMLIVLLPFLLFFFYNILFEILNVGQSPGKMAMGTKVVRLDGKDPEWPS